MSTHGCFAPLFPPLSMLQPDGGAQEVDATFDHDDYYYPEGAYYHVTDADD